MNAHNVFSGPSALLDYYNPHLCPPLPLVELPAHPFIEDGVRIYAKMMTALPATNIKSLPALNMLLRARERGTVTAETKTLIECSSGNTVMSLGPLARMMGIENVKANMSNKTSQAKLDLLRFFGLELTLFGGPAQTEPADLNGGIHAASQEGQRPGRYSPNQYSNPHNPEAHQRWTGPQIMLQMPSVSIFAAGIGTAGTMTGTGQYLKSTKPSVTNVGVFVAPGERIPGPRPDSLMGSIDFPWREVVDASEDVTAKAAYRTSMELSRSGILVGPSSGMTLCGLYKYLQRAKDAGTLDQHRDSEGQIVCVFICCDLPYLYISEYFAKLDETDFRPINNSDLLGVDSYPYLDDWEISLEDAHTRLASSAPVPTLATSSRSSPLPEEATSAYSPAENPAIVLDLRNNEDFNLAHFSNAINFDLRLRGQPNPFTKSAILISQWKAFDSRLIQNSRLLAAKSEGRPIIVVCYNGNSAKIATSVLRHHGWEAWFVSGGLQAWTHEPNIRARL